MNKREMMVTFIRIIFLGLGFLFNLLGFCRLYIWKRGPFCKMLFRFSVQRHGPARSQISMSVQNRIQVLISISRSITSYFKSAMGNRGIIKLIILLDVAAALFNKALLRASVFSSLPHRDALSALHPPTNCCQSCGMHDPHSDSRFLLKFLVRGYRQAFPVLDLFDQCTRKQNDALAWLKPEFQVMLLNQVRPPSSTPSRHLIKQQIAQDVLINKFPPNAKYIQRFWKVEICIIIVSDRI